MKTRQRRVRSWVATTRFLAIPVELLPAEVIVVDLGGGSTRVVVDSVF